MNLLVLYGPPGVGKLTVARELVTLTGYKLFHNHLTLNLVTSVFDFGSAAAGRLSTRFRLEMFREAAKANLSGLIFTFVYAKGADDDFIQQVLDAVEPHGGNVLFVLLTCGKRNCCDGWSRNRARRSASSAIPRRCASCVGNMS